MSNSNCLEKLVQPILSDLRQDLTEKPFFVVTQADLQGYLYSKLQLKDEFKAPFLASAA